MKNWMLLSPQQAINLFGVPQEIANQEGNRFFGGKIIVIDGVLAPGWQDLPKYLISFIPVHSTNSLVVLHFRTIDAELFDVGDYNAFESPFGKHLDQKMVSWHDLSKILTDYARQMPYAADDDVSLSEVTTETLEQRGIVPIKFEDEYLPVYYLLSTQSTQIEAQDREILLDFHVYRESHEVLFRAYSLFGVSKEMASDFVPNNYQINRIVFSRRGLERFAQLLAELASKTQDG